MSNISTYTYKFFSESLPTMYFSLVRSDLLWSTYIFLLLLEAEVFHSLLIGSRHYSRVGKPSALKTVSHYSCDVMAYLHIIPELSLNSCWKAFCEFEELELLLQNRGLLMQFFVRGISEEISLEIL